MVHGGLPPAQIGPFIKDINFPANKKEVIQHVQNSNADEEVVATLENLPNQKFNSSQELKRILGDIQRQF
jgi:methionine salvage enolase-phosphatase E1